MKTSLKAVAVAFALFVGAWTFGVSGSGAAASPDWSMNATIIEACTCPMFCQCYFNAEPAAHGGGHHGEGGEHYCRFNNAFRINKGSYGSVKLDGVKFWTSGDLGAEFSTWKGSWGVLTFDKASTKEQRDAIAEISKHLYPVKWGSMKTAEGVIDWKAEKGHAHALIDGGKTAEVKLQSPGGANTAGEPVVIKNLKYWSTPRNDGFVLMPNVVQAYRVGDKPYESKGTNGFMITFDIDSKSVAQAEGASGM